jgi:hypothetical protein
VAAPPLSYVGPGLSLFGGVHAAQSERFGDGPTHRQFAPQNPVETGPLDAVTFGKSRLAAFPFNCCLEQSDNISVVKYKCVSAYFAGWRSVPVTFIFPSFCHPRTDVRFRPVLGPQIYTAIRLVRGDQPAIAFNQLPNPG